MKTLTILGSPKKKGQTSKVLQIFEDKLATHGHEVERINVVEYQLNGCLGCYACTRTLDEPGCVQKDDFQAIYEKMSAADAIVYASPLYGWDVTAQIKTLFDRHFSLVKGAYTVEHQSFLEDKTISFLITCGGAEENNADLVRPLFDRFVNYVKAKDGGKYIVTHSMAPDFIQRAEEVAENMAARIMGA